MIDLPVVALDVEAAVPARARSDDAGVDLVARCDALLAAGGGRATVPTGIAVAIPAGHAGLVLARSGLAARHGVTCLNAPGLIDPGYRGEVAVVLVNTDPTEAYEVRRGDRIAQLVVVELANVAFLGVDSLDETERSEGGFGHTGR